MLPNRISAKFFVTNPASLQVAAFIPVFHAWIREARVPGVPIDVVNYSHVKDGPSLLLVGHAGDYGLDFAGGRAGLRYVHKRDWPGATLASRLQTTLEGLLLGAQLLAGTATEPVAGALREAPPVTFDTAELELTFPDRLQTPNSAHTFALLKDEVHTVLAGFYGTDAVRLSQAAQDERLLLTIHAQAPLGPTLAELQSRLAAIDGAAPATA